MDEAQDHGTRTRARLRAAGRGLAAAASLSALLLTAGQAQALTCLRGANVAGAEFGDTIGRLGHTHFYPTEKTLRYLAGKGMNVVRFPFKWERLQPVLYKPFDLAELTPLVDSIAAAKRMGFKVILSPHTNARHSGKQIGSPEVPTSAFEDFWTRLAKLYAGDSDIIFLLQNEPDYMDAAFWLPSANAGIAAIRRTGADNLILVPGTIWTSAYHWFAEQNGGSNAEVMRGIIDPLNNYAIDIHQYPDADFSGTNRTCPAKDTALEALARVTDWLKATGNRAILSEFGGTASPDCLDAIRDMAVFVNRNPDTWIGWTYWAAGDWWGDYPLSIQPDEAGRDRPQMKVLEPLIRDGQPVIAECPSLDPLTFWPLRGPNRPDAPNGRPQ
ncbi:cellulase family glycosylhydrolase [Microvirga tunisiensis]|uniref:Cellulase family glycosylhydrolase n=1 Tax=Pannonibacter tanglangensis TaxID=2750084 RepID=A0A7X5F422_9HYPH|nr:glycoside hydrolase family 5 protein [Pannonibacter sp. XCT-53]NBN79402.1 cellulase family glycosylhydrolase [Pannonibacter sp. XCT-53]